MRDGGANAAFKIMTFLGSWAGIKVEVRGLEKLKNHVGPAVLLSNHQSSIDLMMLGHYMPDKCCIMSKKSLQYVPVFGIAGVFAHTIFIDRTDKTQALKSVEKSCDIINNSGFKLFMYPEGTRNHGHGLLPFKKGAFNIAVTGDIPIIPIVISDYANFYSKPNKYFHNDGKVICEVLDQIKTVGMGKEDVNALVEKTRNAMLECYERISKEVERPNQS
uniref:1-acyl-sn-glycerol-3-phosphate acyltransferase n=1 Tax=Rhabditophanes sp. KR3021 TaxID=114890 RepID=A0AC35TPY2_9BILA